MLSNVERYFQKNSGRQPLYEPVEKMPIIEVENFPMLGQLTALRFLEWVQKNPQGVIALPTGKTPEYFIKYTQYYLNRWDTPEVQEELTRVGFKSLKKPVMNKLRFVQIDEFFPINPSQKNSFYYYVQKFYIQGFGLNPDRALLLNVNDMGLPPEHLNEIFPDQKVDLSLRHRQPANDLEQQQKQVIEQVDQFCTEYENRIQEMGGIGFFLGGIGPDGHIAFNIRGSDLYSTTRLTTTNYETQAAAASDLGGIEISRNRLVITIGLQTLWQNPDAVAIIIAAGEAKSRVVADAVQQQMSNQYPATALHQLDNARFYLTHGAAKDLIERRIEDFKKQNAPSFEAIEKVVLDLAIAKQKPLLELDQADLRSNPFTRHLLSQMSLSSLLDVIKSIYSDLEQKINRGVQEVKGKTFMHTAPHHDDIMLGYLPYIYHLVRVPENQHFFNYMTSGFTAVTNEYVLDSLNILLQYIETSGFENLMQVGYFRPAPRDNQDWDVYFYLDGVAAHNTSKCNEAYARRLLRILVQLYDEESIQHLKDRVSELIDYFRTQYPGKKDMPHIQKLKGMIREWEADLLWAHFGFDSKSVNHLRLGFYQGDIFTEEPKKSRDVKPILRLLKNIQPDVVTVAFDPEGSGPDTHYKVMQALAEALNEYTSKDGVIEPEIWGYRNVWYRFHPSESTEFVPVSLNSMAVLENTFLTSFGSQSKASFPSYELDGPFSRLAVKIQADQFKDIKVCLGEAFFNENTHPRLRACHGLCFIKKMSLNEFIEHTRELRKKVEAEDDHD